MAAYDFTADEFAQVWEAFHAHADPETHFLSVADLQATLTLLSLFDRDDDVTWFIRHVNAVDTGKLSFIKLVKGVGDLIDKKGRKKRSNAGRRFTWREIAELFRLFMSIDIDRSGEISFSELYKALRLINPKAKVNDVLSMFSVLDVDKSHAIDFPEFVRGISLGGEAISGPIIAPESTAPKPATRGATRTAAKEINYSPKISETSEIFRNVDGGSYAREISSPHFPTMTKRSAISPSKSRPLELENTFESSPPTSSARLKTERAPSSSGTRLYSNWAAKNAKAAPVLDQRVPTAIVSTRPSFFPGSSLPSPSSSSFSSSPSSSFKSTSPTKSYRFPPL